ncbi:hypothetical protein VCV18_005989 [Metarhizium anisopliae]
MTDIGVNFTCTPKDGPDTLTVTHLDVKDQTGQQVDEFPAPDSYDASQEQPSQMRLSSSSTSKSPPTTRPPRNLLLGQNATSPSTSPVASSNKGNKF